MVGGRWRRRRQARVPAGDRQGSVAHRQGQPGRRRRPSTWPPATSSPRARSSRPTRPAWASSATPTARSCGSARPATTRSRRPVRRATAATSSASSAPGKTWHRVTPKDADYAVKVTGATGTVVGTSISVVCPARPTASTRSCKGQLRRRTPCRTSDAELEAGDQVEVKFGRIEPVRRLTAEEMAADPWIAQNMTLDGETAPSIAETTTTIEGETTTTLRGETTIPGRQRLDHPHHAARRAAASAAGDHRRRHVAAAPAPPATTPPANSRRRLHAPRPRRRARPSSRRGATTTPSRPEKSTGRGVPIREARLRSPGYGDEESNGGGRACGRTSSGNRRHRAGRPANGNGRTGPARITAVTAARRVARRTRRTSAGDIFTRGFRASSQGGLHNTQRRSGLHATRKKPRSAARSRLRLLSFETPRRVGSGA